MKKELESSHVESTNGDAKLSKGDIDNTKLGNVTHVDVVCL
jgi:hypothetical protein